MTPNDLQGYLDAYDTLSGSNSILSLQQEQFLRNLRMLARANALLDISSHVEKYMKTIPNPPSDTNAQTPIEKLISVLRQIADPSILMPNATTLSTATTSAEIVSDQEQAVEWLGQLIQEVTSRIGGSATLIRTPSALTLTLSGSVPMKYSIFMALMSCEAVAKTAYLDQQHIDGDLSVILNEANLKTVMQRSKALSFVKQFLQELGLEVEMGSKTCEQSLSENAAFASRDALKMQKMYNMSLNFADALKETQVESIVFPLTIKISTFDDNLMGLLESYYVHPLVNLNGRDGKPKTFIPETKAPGLRHESVLNLPQLVVLKDFFERLAYFAQYSGIPATQLNEATMQSITENIYSDVKEDTNLFNKSFVDPSYTFEVKRQYPQLSGKPTSNNLSTVAAFTSHVKNFCETVLIPGSKLFMDDIPFIKKLNEIQANIFQSDSYQKWPNFKESYHPDPNCKTPRSPIPLYYYPQAIARSVQTQTRSRIGVTEQDHKLGLEWLNKIVNRPMYGSAASQHYYDFYTENNAYYLLDSCVSCINLCLDHPGCTDDHIRELLQALRLSETSIERLQMSIAGQSYFNRFQIKLFLLPIVLHCLCKEKLLENYTDLILKKDPWVDISMPNSEAKFSPKIDDWQREMARWCNMKIEGLPWTVGGPSSSERKKNHQDTIQQHRFFAGGTQAVQHRVKKAEEQKTSVCYGSSG